MYKETCEVLENRKVAPGHYVLKLRSKKIARAALPGQFVQVLCNEGSLDPLLPRPFSFLTAAAGDLSVLYHVVGKGTALMERFSKGAQVPLLGPLGNGFSALSALSPRPATLLLVGGGVGIPPLYHLAEHLLRHERGLKKSIHVFLGARHKSLLLCENEFKKLGVNLHTATDDGSRGKKGFVTSLLTAHLKKDHMKTRIFCCGPTPMLKAVSLIGSEFGVPCEASVEVPMACGFGACLGCAIKVKGAEPGSHRFAIACTEGPVFEGAKVLWE
jgi:dihydroorotate dehydrogenase electron transfer subunit